MYVADSSNNRIRKITPALFQDRWRVAAPIIYLGPEKA
ncbi:MAG: hypothetical protein LBV36_02720 [Chromatiales bacterium]|nr:hypothetical protein [Chromatiales bacterium]